LDLPRVSEALRLTPSVTLLRSLQGAGVLTLPLRAPVSTQGSADAAPGISPPTSRAATAAGGRRYMFHVKHVCSRSPSVALKAPWETGGKFSLRSAGTLPCRILSDTRAKDFTHLRDQALTQLRSYNRPPMPTSRGPGARPARRRAACSAGIDSVHTPPGPLPREVPRRTMRRARPPPPSRFWGGCTRRAVRCHLLRRTETALDGRISGAPAS